MSSFQHADRVRLDRPDHVSYDLVQFNNLECTVLVDAVRMQGSLEQFGTANLTRMDLVQANPDEKEAVRFV